MTRDEIIKLAREAGLTTGVHISGATSGVTLVGAPSGVKIAHITIDDFDRFAALVAAKEREACARLCDARYMGDNSREDMEARRCADAIRAKGEK